MTDLQSWTNPELLRRSACCGADVKVRNAKTWCYACGQHILRPSDVFGMFKPEAPAPPPPGFAVARSRRRRGPGPGQEAML